MKSTLALLTMMVILSSATCRKAANKPYSECFKGRVEIKGICSNYTIRLLEGNMDTAFLNASWTDENTGKTHKNVFGIRNPCVFDKNLEEGQEFYFRIDSTTANNCTVCMAYYPTPPKKLTIKVLAAPCP
jgi:hypothetical protein